MPKILILIACTALAACVSISTTRKPENLTRFTVNAGYQTTFRIIDENLKKCFPIGYVHSVLYPDQQRAAINVSSNLSNTVWFSADIKHDGSGASVVDFYSAYSSMRKEPVLFQGWVNEGKTGCS